MLQLMSVAWQAVKRKKVMLTYPGWIMGENDLKRFDLDGGQIAGGNRVCRLVLGIDENQTWRLVLAPNTDARLS